MSIIIIVSFSMQHTKLNSLNKQKFIIELKLAFMGISNWFMTITPLHLACLNTVYDVIGYISDISQKFDSKFLLLNRNRTSVIYLESQEINDTFFISIFNRDYILRSANIVKFQNEINT